MSKSTKTQIRKALDSFLYTYADLTGGTSQEVRNQAPQGIIRLEKLAADFLALTSNPNKAAASDSHLMSYTETVQAKIARYSEMYLAEPKNIIQFTAA